MKNILIISLLCVLININSEEFSYASWSTHFKRILSEVKKIPMKKLSVAAAEDSNVLEAVHLAKEKGIADSVLVGDEEKIRKIAKELNINIDQFKIINEPDQKTAAMKAVKLVHDGECDMYMKGILPTKEFLKSILDKEVGLRTGKVLSHIAVMEVKGIPKLLFMTDGGFIINPTLEEKVHLIENAVKVARACGIEKPKVAPLCAVEVVNPKMQCTVDAAELTKLNQQGIIKDCIVDGPISLDMAIDREACEHKGALNRAITGDADILLFPDIHSNNIAAKFVGFTTENYAGLILAGTSARVILTSRGSETQIKLTSIAFASYIAENLKKLN